ncbi:MAG: hypothetical protein J6C13_02310, partial [Clostridia bacterium]|nr:hypothetical protein [Clostridia bacterium]
TSLKILDNNIVYTWQAVEGATSYNISMLNGETYTTNAVVSSAGLYQSLNLSSKGLTLGAGDALFASVSAQGTNNGYIASPYTDIVSLFGNGNMADFANVKYSFVGKQFDLVADSYDELKTIVFFTLYYRITNMQLFINYTNYQTSSINGDYSLALKAYDEIKYIQHSNLTANGKTKGYNFTVKYYHTNYPTKTAEQTTNCYQNTEVKPSTYTDTPRDDNFDNFKVEQRTNTMMVYNSDQLYYAVEYGCKPVFPNGDSPAKVVYNASKNVLRNIISDDMSDYDKSLAIYDWICYNVHYDYDLVELSETMENSIEPWKIHDYRGFYIEGVLFDSGQAVCDGIGKTYALLCGIEGIECYKVTGGAGEQVGTDENGQPVYPGHAWNKIKLDLVGNDGIGEWYALDATWSDFNTKKNANDCMETLNHSFFLRTDSWLTNKQMHHESGPLTDVANTYFDYYDYTTYDGTNDILIDNVTELNNLATFVKNANLDSIEFALNYSTNTNELLAKFEKTLLSIAKCLTRSYENDNGLHYTIYVIYY